MIKDCMKKGKLKVDKDINIIITSSFIFANGGNMLLTKSWSVSYGSKRKRND